MSVIVVREEFRTGKKQEEVVDLATANLEMHYQTELTFSYYYEVDDHTTLTAMQPKLQPTFEVFVELYDGEPIDTSIEKVKDYLTMHSDRIPADI